MTRLGATIISLLAAATLVVGGAGGARAQLDLPPLLPTTTTTVPGAPPPPPSTTTTTAPPSLLDSVLKPPASAPPTTPAPPTTAARTAGPLLPGNDGGEGDAPPADAGPFPADLARMMNSVRRTRPNNSNSLVDALKILTDAGMSPGEALRVGMGRYPIGGRSNYSHDWWYPRFGPGWRLHQGTDVFAARGTPLRSPTTGTVSFSDGGLGGISVYVTQADGTYFYMAHLNSRPPGLKAGQTVNTGDIVGFVGSTGNAAGGSPHLHFEVHPAIRFVTVGKGRKATTKAVSAPVRPGTVLPAIDPKPLLDLYLHEALQALPGIAAAYQADAASAAAAAPAGDAVPVESAAIQVATRHLAVGGLIAAEAPLVRTPLLLMAFLLIVMVLVLFPVLAPRRRLAFAGVRPVPRPAGPRVGRRPGRRAKAGTPPAGSPEPPPAEATVVAPEDAPATPPVRFNGNVSANRGAGKGRAGRGGAKADAPEPAAVPRPRVRSERRRRKHRTSDDAEAVTPA